MSPVLLFLAGLGAAAAGFYGLPVVFKQAGLRALQREVRARRSLVLTYDDGPGAYLTPRILDELQRFDARASFFPLGHKAEAGASLLDAVAAAGHEIGCHARHHVHAWRSLPPAAIRDARNGLRDLAPWQGQTSLFRPPYGKLDLATQLLLRARGIGLAWWTFDSGDTCAPRPAPQQVADALRRRGGGVVLLHDFDDNAERNEYVLATTRALLEMARAEGLRVEPLGELLAAAAAS